MKFVQVDKLVALCLCLGVLCTHAQNLRPRLLAPDCFVEGDTCTKKRDCCEGLNCVGPRTDDGSKTCESPGCIPDGKQCNNGKRPYDCCFGSFCELQEDGKQMCVHDRLHDPIRLLEPECTTEGRSCTKKKDCCEGLNCVGTFRNDGTKTCESPGAGNRKEHCIPTGKQCNNGERPHICCKENFCELQEDGKQICVHIYTHLLPDCVREHKSCTKKKDCCEGLNCIGPPSIDGTKRCQKPGGCIPIGKQCRNGKNPHLCCVPASCELQEDGKHSVCTLIP